MNAGPTSMIGLRDTEMGTDIDRATIVLLRYIEALDGRQFEHVEPGEIFAAMSKQVPGRRTQPRRGCREGNFPATSQGCMAYRCQTWQARGDGGPAGCEL